jgi:hypothetical protein
VLTADTRPDASRMGGPGSLVDVLLLGDSLSPVAAGAPTWQTTVLVQSEKRRRRLLQGRLAPLPSRWTLAGSRPMSSEGA